MLSPERKELLRKNRGRIKALIMDPEDQECDCLYDYGDGTICAASACLTDEEREILIPLFNSSSIDGSYCKKETPTISDSDRFVMAKMQNLHDRYIDENLFYRDRNPELLQELNELINKILS